MFCIFIVFVCLHRGDHTESVMLEFDAAKITYEELLDMFWKNHSCTTPMNRQYMSAIFYHSEEQRKKALSSRDALQKTMSKKIMTKIEAAQTFYDAEKYG